MEVAVAVTSRLLAAVSVLLGCMAVQAGVLPDDRADVLYHSYDGGGVEINGPSLLVLKKIGQDVALTGNYYVDSISSASIDVVTRASAYSEERTELSGGIDYQHGNSTLSLSYTNSDESDYQADTASFGVSMDMFGNMTTVSMGYSRGWDTVGARDTSLAEQVDRQNYRIGISQVITKDLLLEVNYEGITDEGFLRNPYRAARILDDTAPNGYRFMGGPDEEPELYPRTRTSSALALRARHYLPWRAAVSGEYRFFADTWGIDAHTFEIGYTHTFPGGWILDTSLRHYTQGAADFYTDLLPDPADGSQNFYGRDKELSSFSSNTFGVKLGYELIRQDWHGIERGTLSLAWNSIWFDYDNFRDLRVVLPPEQAGSEPLYSFHANVVQLYLSLFY